MAEAVGRYRSIIRPSEKRGGSCFSFKRDGCFASSTVRLSSLSFLPRIYGFMKGDSTAKTRDPSTVKRVSGQAEQRERESSTLLWSFSVWGRERSRATITLQGLHLILLLAAHRTGVINSPLPSPFRNIRVPKLAGRERSPGAQTPIPADYKTVRQAHRDSVVAFRGCKFVLFDISAD